jgi:hypothetical protein
VALNAKNLINMNTFLMKSVYLEITFIISIISLLISPLLGHRPSLWITHKENGP